MPAGTRAQALQTRANSSGVVPVSPQVAPRLARKVHWPPTKKSWPHFRPSAGTAAPSVAPARHNFANDLAVSIDERHSPLRFIAAERLRGRVKRRDRGGLGRVGAFCFRRFMLFTIR